MDTRQSKLLAAIIDQFIETALPVGSRKLLESGTFVCSSATIRAEMVFWEEGGYLAQPHISAGRVPTAKGYRCYVKDFLEPARHERAVRRKFDTLREQYMRRKDQERVYDAVAILAHLIPNVAFAKVPHKPQVYYLGLGHAFRQPEFRQDPLLASDVAEVLEEHLGSVLDTFTVDGKIRYYIGESDLLPKTGSCALLVTEYRVRDQRGAIGILGPMRMDYAYNTVALDMAADLLRSG